MSSAKQYNPTQAPALTATDASSVADIFLGSGNITLTATDDSYMAGICSGNILLTTTDAAQIGATPRFYHNRIGELPIRSGEKITLRALSGKDFHTDVTLTLWPEGHLIATLEVVSQLEAFNQSQPRCALSDTRALSITELDNGLVDCVNISGDVFTLSNIH